MAFSKLKLIRSRRQMLGDAAAIGAAAMLLGNATGSAATADIKAKATQKSVDYQSHHKAGKGCNSCGAFQPQSACKTVESPVEAAGWCSQYKAS